MLHGAPARFVLDAEAWLGSLGHFDRPEAFAAARARATELARDALGEDPDAWWAVAGRPAEFTGTFPQLLGQEPHRDAMSTR